MGRLYGPARGEHARGERTREGGLGRFYGRERELYGPARELGRPGGRARGGPARGEPGRGELGRGGLREESLAESSRGEEGDTDREESWEGEEESWEGPREGTTGGSKAWESSAGRSEDSISAKEGL